MNASTATSIETPPLPKPHIVRSLIGDANVYDVTGRVAAVAGDTVEIEGMAAALGSICELIPTLGERKLARVIGFNNNRIVLAPLERLTSVSAGDTARLVDSSAKIRVGPSLCGRVIDAFGRPLDHKPLPLDLVTVDSERAPPHSLSRPPIDTPLQTGIRAIDAMLTCGQGQRLGIFAGSGVGKSTLLGMLARGSNADRIVIGLVGERGREVQEFIDHSLGDEGLKRSVVVVATSDTPAAQRVAAASTATAIAESFRDDGENVLLLMDSVSRYATAQRELGLAAGEPPTTRGYPPSVFNMLPRLVERAGRSANGSITAFYSVLVEGDDPNEPVADTLRGLLDGHIVLDRTLASEAHWPPINVVDSLSRLQPHLVDQQTLAASTDARRLLSDYRHNQDLISIGAYRQGSDPVLDRAIEMRPGLKDFLTQDSTEVAMLPESQKELASLIGRK